VTELPPSDKTLLPSPKPLVKNSSESVEAPLPKVTTTPTASVKQLVAAYGGTTTTTAAAAASLSSSAAIAPLPNDPACSPLPIHPWRRSKTNPNTTTNTATTNGYLTPERIRTAAAASSLSLGEADPPTTTALVSNLGLGAEEDTAVKGHAPPVVETIGGSSDDHQEYERIPETRMATRRRRRVSAPPAAWPDWEVIAWSYPKCAVGIFPLF
jgi:hypothetical protein